MLNTSFLVNFGENNILLVLDSTSLSIMNLIVVTLTNILLQDSIKD